MSSQQIPTQAELSILKILWDRGPSTVREIQDGLPEETGYTTVLKFLQIMHKKGMVDREKEGRAHRYRAVLQKEVTQQKMLGDFTDRLFDGSVQQLMQRAVSSENVGREDLDELEDLLKKLRAEKENKGDD